MLIQRHRSFLLVIDMQERLLPVIHDGEAAVRNAGILIRAARELDIPLLASEQYVKGLGPTVAALLQILGNAPRLEKMHFSCTADDALRARLEDHAAAGRNQAVLAGTEAHVCVLQTALGLRELGFEVFVVADATASRKAENHALAMQRCRHDGVRVVATEMVVFEWLHVSGTDEFRAVSKLIK